MKSMKLNTIILLMTVMLLATVSVGGYYFYYIWNNAVDNRIREHSQVAIELLHSEVNTYLGNKRKPVKTLANMPAIKDVLVNNTESNLQQANQVLDIFCTTLESLTCYLMDAKGTTIASSNRDSKYSFVGKNYSFRPYFKNAILGKPSIYLARGVTSKKRGAYFSHPVALNNKPAGVVVIKVSVSELEKRLVKTRDIIALTGPGGIVFAASQKDWLFKSMWTLTSEKYEQLAKTRQFGDVLPSSVGLTQHKDGQVTDSNNNHYIMSQKELSDIPGWWISHFHNSRLTADHQDDVFNQMIGYTAVFLFMLITAITLLLNRFARNEIKTRKQIEQDLIKATKDALHANKVKSDFLSNMSHELRTPMNAILGFGQLLILEATELSKSQKNHVNEILDAGYHLLNLINEVLDLAKIESGKLEIFMWEVGVDEIMRQSLALIKPQLIARQIKLTDNICGKGYIVHADAIRFKQVLINLLSNAVKYNCENGCITVDSEVIDKQRLRISIKDTGKGLTKQDISKLFMSFERLDKENTVEGAGIGLVITKNLVELMGGTIGVESTPGKGSTFWVEFALVESEQKAVGKEHG